MRLRNDRGLTLVELLVTLAIAFSILGLVSSVLMQSFKNMEMADTTINLRQEANILIANFTSAHMSSINMSDESTYRYPISYSRINSNEWELQLGRQTITNQKYNIRLVLEQKFPDELYPRNFTIDPNTTVTTTPFEIEKKLPVTIKKLILIDKKDSSKTFELSTIISRL